MLQKTIGFIPHPFAPCFKQRDVRAALDALRIVPTYGGLVIDQTGLGKTIQVLLFLAIFVNFHIEIENGRAAYRTILLVVPSTVIKQWADEIAKHWAATFSLIISYGEYDGINATVDRLSAEFFEICRTYEMCLYDSVTFLIAEIHRWAGPLY